MLTASLTHVFRGLFGLLAWYSWCWPCGNLWSQHSAQKAEVGGTLWVRDQPNLHTWQVLGQLETHSETLPQKTNEQVQIKTKQQDIRVSSGRDTKKETCSSHSQGLKASSHTYSQQWRDEWAKLTKTGRAWMTPVCPYINYCHTVILPKLNIHEHHPNTNNLNYMTITVLPN